MRTQRTASTTLQTYRPRSRVAPLERSGKSLDRQGAGDDIFQQRPEIEFPGFEWEGTGVIGAPDLKVGSTRFAPDFKNRPTRIAGEMLEPDGRLAFECHGTGEAEQRGDRVEEPPHRGAHATRMPDRRSSFACSNRFGKVERRASEVREVVELLEEGRGGLNRVTRRSVSSRHSHRSQVAGAYESFADAAGEQLTSPRRAIVAVAGAVEACGDHPDVPCLALREDRRHVCSMMLDSQDPAGGAAAPPSRSTDRPGGSRTRPARCSTGPRTAASGRGSWHRRIPGFVRPRDRRCTGS